jgi:hypothetical protein
MVDQLWIWVLGPSLIVTSFPQDWQYSRTELPDLLSSIQPCNQPTNGWLPYLNGWLALIGQWLINGWL